MYIVHEFAQQVTPNPDFNHTIFSNIKWPLDLEWPRFQRNTIVQRWISQKRHKI